MIGFAGFGNFVTDERRLYFVIYSGRCLTATASLDISPQRCENIFGGPVAAAILCVMGYYSSSSSGQMSFACFVFVVAHGAFRKVFNAFCLCFRSCFGTQFCYYKCDHRRFRDFQARPVLLRQASGVWRRSSGTYSMASSAACIRSTNGLA